MDYEFYLVPFIILCIVLGYVIQAEPLDSAESILGGAYVGLLIAGVTFPLVFAPLLVVLEILGLVK